MVNYAFLGADDIMDDRLCQQSGGHGRFLKVHADGVTAGGGFRFYP
jgi:hypothetical protein